MPLTRLIKPMAVNLITGALGAGKTTLLRHLLAHKPANEHWWVLVNEFGLVGLDGAILSEHSAKNLTIEEIPGGCICCSALGELTQSLQRIINATPEVRPQRILIEPTGLGEPDSLVDLLKSPLLAQHFEVQTVFAVFDSTRIQADDFERYTILQNLANMADVLVFNKADLVNAQETTLAPALRALHQYALQLYPPKAHILFTQHAKIEPTLRHLTSAHAKNGQPIHRAIFRAIHGHTPPITRPGDTAFDAVPYPTQTLQHLVARRYRQDHQHITIGWVFNDQACFDWRKVQALFESLNPQSHTLQDTQPSPGLVNGVLNNVQRAKGVFKVGKPSMLFQWVNQQTQRELIAYRRDSRLELLIEIQPTELDEIKLDFAGFERELVLCLQQ